MRADHAITISKHALIAVFVGFAISLAIPEVALGRCVATILAMVLYVYFDLRSRLNQLYEKPICLGKSCDCGVSESKQ